MSIQIATSIAKHFGITVSAEDAPKIIAAIQNAYATGKADEREACAQVCEAQLETGAHLRCAKAIRERARA